jgi:hypothetical protein
MLLLAQGFLTPLPLATASNANPFASEDAYEQLGRAELAAMVAARHSLADADPDPPLEQVRLQLAEQDERPHRVHEAGPQQGGMRSCRSGQPENW